jgi:hypothetical protein
MFRRLALIGVLLCAFSAPAMALLRGGFTTGVVGPFQGDTTKSIFVDHPQHHLSAIRHAANATLHTVFGKRDDSQRIEQSLYRSAICVDRQQFESRCFPLPAPAKQRP